MAKKVDEKWYGAETEITADGLTIIVTLPMETAPKGRIQNRTTVPSMDPELMNAAGLFYLCRGAAQHCPPDDKVIWENRLSLAEAQLKRVEADRDEAFLEPLLKAAQTEEEKATLTQRIEAIEERKIKAMGRIALAQERELHA